MWALAQLLWEKTVGTGLRAKEQAEELEAAKKAAAYEKSKRELIRRQQQE